MQLYGGPLDGAQIDGPNVGPDVFQRGIGRKTITFADGETTAPVWIFCDTDPEGRVTYKRDNAGKFRHVRTEKYRCK